MIYTANRPEESGEYDFRVIPANCNNINCSDYLDIESIECIGEDDAGNIVFQLNCSLATTMSQSYLVYGSVQNALGSVVVPGLINNPAVNNTFTATYIVPPPAGDQVCLQLLMIDPLMPTNACVFTDCIQLPLCPVDPSPEKTVFTQEQHLKLELYPNPAGSMVQVTYSVPEPGAVINLMDATGRKKTVSHVFSEHGFVKFDLESLEPGIYFIELLDTSGSRLVKKLIHLKP